MKKLRRNLPIILAAITILGMLVVTGHAKRPTAPPEPTVTVTGAIEILPDGSTTDPANVRVQFVDSSFGPLAGKSFPANADHSPALYTVIMKVPADPVDKALRFYYCAHASHSETDLRCQDPEGHKDSYYCLTLHYGESGKKGIGNLNHLTFPKDTWWTISPKTDLGTGTEGYLKTKATYDYDIVH
jgi:hypothetical protein